MVDGDVFIDPKSGSNGGLRNGLKIHDELQVSRWFRADKLRLISGGLKEQ